MKISEVVEEYISLRNDIAAKRKEYKDLEALNKELMNELELRILEVANSTGVDSFKTVNGTAYKTIKKYATNSDRAARDKYAIESGDLGLFTNHVNKAHLLELMDDGLDPEDVGITYTEEQAINIRKS